MVHDCTFFITQTTIPSGIQIYGDKSKPWYLLFTPSHSWVKMDVHPTKNGIFIGIDPYPYIFWHPENVETELVQVRAPPQAPQAPQAPQETGRAPLVGLIVEELWLRYPLVI